MHLVVESTLFTEVCCNLSRLSHSKCSAAGAACARSAVAFPHAGGTATPALSLARLVGLISDRCSRLNKTCFQVRVRHSIAIYGQILLFCDQSMREKAWRSRKRGAEATRALHPACTGSRQASWSDTLAASQAFKRMHVLCFKLRVIGERMAILAGFMDSVAWVSVLLGTLVLDLWLSVLCMRSKAWLAACVSLRLARLPRTASTALSAHVACAPRARLRQSFSHTPRSQKNKIFFNGSKT
jgi:hypothetical protein